jgi:hypothetical protein
VYRSTTVSPQRYLYFDEDAVDLEKYVGTLHTAAGAGRHRWYIDTDLDDESGRRGGRSGSVGDVPFTASVGVYSAYGRLPPIGTYSTWIALCGDAYVRSRPPPPTILEA